MKKSEMLSIMQEAVNEWHLKYVGNPDGYSCNKHILKRMEEAGMKPPYCEKIYQEEARIFINPNGNQWEKEDE